MGKLYIRYQLDVADSEVVEMRDVICLLKDKKELYIQKDHLSAKLDICRCVCGVTHAVMSKLPKSHTCVK